jgi:cytochrome d ubiquinol oxidase subunit I
MEAHFHTRTHAPFVIGGVPSSEAQSTRFGLELPSALSLLIGHSRETEVSGLDRVPRENWPNVKLVHWSFDLMVGCGMLLAALAAWTAWTGWRKRSPLESRALIKAYVIATPLGFLAIETGWMVTELGRQPWVVFGFMRTRDAVTSMPHLGVPFYTITALYLLLSVVVVALMRRQFLETSKQRGKISV